MSIAGFSTEPLRAQNVSQPQNTGPSDPALEQVRDIGIQQMHPDTKAKLRRMAKLLDD